MNKQEIAKPFLKKKLGTFKLNMTQKIGALK
jgi:hypothetical protein